MSELRSLFEYDMDRSLGNIVISRSRDDGATILDLTYRSPLGGEVPAFLVLPDSKGRHPAVIFLHPQEPGDRETFVPEARRLAGYGVASLLIASPFRRPEAPPLVTGTPDDADPLRQTVIDLRRGIDLFLARDDVDGSRIAFVGMNYGASMGAVLSGVERRISAYVLMGGTPSRTAFWTSDDRRARALASTVSDDEFREFLNAVGQFDAVHYIGHAAPAKLLFQFGTRDRDLSAEAARAYVARASEPKEVRWYDTDNRLGERVVDDHIAWLAEQLGFQTR